MKRLLQLIIILLIANYSFGQAKKIQYNPGYDKRFFHMGFTIGFNTLGYRITPSKNLLYTSQTEKVYRIEPHKTLGINLGIVSDMRVGEYINIRFLPGMIFGQRNLEYTVRDLSFPDEMKFYTYDMRVPSIYLDAPLSIKFKANRINNYRPYLIAGMAFKYDLETRRVARENKEYTIKQEPLDYFYEFGFGVDWYLVYFKLSTEFKYSFGLQDIMIAESGEEYADVIEHLKSRMFILSFHFE